MNSAFVGISPAVTLALDLPYMGPLLQNLPTTRMLSLLVALSQCLGCLAFSI